MGTVIPLRLRRAWAGVALLALTGSALSAPTLVGTTTDPTGIDNLVIDGTTYDVTFSTTSFDSTFTFLSTGGMDAALAIANAFNSFGVTELGDVTGDLTYTVLIENDAPAGADCAFFDTPPGLPWVNGTCAGFVLGQQGAAPIFEFADAAHFSVANVPEPATVALFGLGLVGVMLSRRRFPR